MTTTTIPNLTTAGCRERQARLVALLTELDVAAAWLWNRKHVYYFTGHDHRGPMSEVGLLLTADGQATLVTDGTAAPETVDARLAYDSHQLCTQVEDRVAAMHAVVAERLRDLGRVAVDRGLPPALAASVTQVDAMPAMLRLRRRKDADELALIRHAITATEAAWDCARELLRPGLLEIDLYAAMRAAAVRAVGEPITDWGNDFQAGGPGGPPRQRAMQAGELIPLDISVGVRGYWSDMSRTFSVDGQVTDLQRSAHARVVEALAVGQAAIRPGASCRALYETVHAMLHGYRGWSFPHHLGHAIGLDGHEAPRINPHWDDHFAAGDVVTLEPGLYHPDLGGGIRLETDFLVIPTGCTPLSTYPLDL